MTTGPDLASLSAQDAARLVSQAVGASDYRRAYELADAAIAKGAVHPVLFNARAIWLEAQKRDEEALADFERAASLLPNSAPILNAIGLCLTRLYRLDEAIAAFDEAIRFSPSYAPSYHRKGIALSMAGDFEAARRAHELALKFNPRDAEALANLGSLAARKGDTKKSQDYAERALKLDPRQPTAIAAGALLANTQGRFVEAEQLARPLLDRPELTRQARAAAFGQLADSLDGQGRIAEAFEAYRAENEELLVMQVRRFGSKRSMTDFTRDLDALVRGAPGDAWNTTHYASKQRHVFVLGFARSGTTLLGQVLGSHSEIVTMEERDFLQDAAGKYLSSAPGLARLMSLSGDELTALREEYWGKIRDRGLSVEGKIFVDKQPLNTIKLPLIAKLFPDAKIVFAVRDPRDVVLSCFRRHFEVNAATFDLLTLTGAANFYDSVMKFAALMRTVLKEPFFVHRYEDMIDDFDGRVGALCSHLGVPFEPAMRKFHQNVNIEDIRTPSALQVTRELYSEGSGQWRRYSDQIKPVVPVLAPWVAQFGYPAE